MQDRVSLYPGRVTLTPVSGQPNTFDLVRADQPTQEGTPLNKATLLKDATAALFGLGTNAVPDDALALLSRFQNGLGNEYVWAKSNNTGIVGYVNSPDSNAYPPAVSDGYTYTALGQLGDKARIATGSYIGTGKYGENNPNRLTFDFQPKLLFVYCSVFDIPYNFFWGVGSNKTYSSEHCNEKITLMGNSVSWYVNNGNSPYNNEKYQLNSARTEYLYVVIG